MSRDTELLDALEAIEEEGAPLSAVLRSIKANCDVCAGCWAWQGALTHAGMPQRNVKTGATRPDGKAQRRTTYVRREVLEAIAAGPMPKGYVAAVLCETPACVAPTCLQAMTKAKQAKIAAKRGAYRDPAKFRKMTMTKRAKSRYSEALIERIRTSDADGVTLALATGVSKSHVNTIRRGVARRQIVNNPFLGLGAR